jgi:DNA adenine methylase (dam)
MRICGGAGRDNASVPTRSGAATPIHRHIAAAPWPIAMGYGKATGCKPKSKGIKPMRSPLAGWRGGKSKLFKKIEQLIPEHECYCEPFAGAAWVLFMKDPALSKSEVINDVNDDLVRFFRVVKYHLKALVEELEWILSSRSEFQRQKDLPPKHMTDVQRAARFFYLLKAGFGGKIYKPTFGYAATARPKFNMARLQDDLLEAHWRLADVFIENLSYTDVLKRYDRQATFFYIDPPYYNCEDHYGQGIFSKEDFDNLSNQLSEIKGYFLLSLNDTPEVRDIFSPFKITGTTTTYTTGLKNKTSAKEVFIRNY